MRYTFKVLAPILLMTSGLALSACGSGSTSKSVQGATSTIGTTSTTNATAEIISNCATNLDSWVTYFQENIFSGSNSFLFSLQNAGLLYGTGGTGGDLGEWIREKALGQTSVSASSECQSFESKGIDVSWVPNANS